MLHDQGWKQINHPGMKISAPTAAILVVIVIFALMAAGGYLSEGLSWIIRAF